MAAGWMWRTYATRAAIATNVVTAARTHDRRSRIFLRAMAGTATPACDPPSAIQRSCSFTSCAVCQRSSGSFARHVRTTRSSAGGDMGCTAEMGCGSDARMAATMLAWLLPVKAHLPDAISYRTAPSAKISDRASASFPSTCSGDMYWKVPSIMPWAVNG